MDNKKKFCIFMFLMALSASNIVKAEDSTLVVTPEVSSQVQDEQQGQIKGLSLIHISEPTRP